MDEGPLGISPSLKRCTDGHGKKDGRTAIEEDGLGHRISVWLSQGQVWKNASPSGREEAHFDGRPQHRGACRCRGGRARQTLSHRGSHLPYTSPRDRVSVSARRPTLKNTQEAAPPSLRTEPAHLTLDRASPGTLLEVDQGKRFVDSCRRPAQFVCAYVHRGPRSGCANLRLEPDDRRRRSA